MQPLGGFTWDTARRYCNYSTGNFSPPVRETELHVLEEKKRFLSTRGERENIRHESLTLWKCRVASDSLMYSRSMHFLRADDNKGSRTII